MKAIETLKSMTGKSWMYKTRTVKILSHKQKGNDISIVTDHSWIETTLGDLPGVLEEFMEVEQDDSAALESTSLQVIQETRTGLTELRGILLENIKQLQDNKEFIPQAKAINNNINTMINMVKLEFQITKEMRSK